MQESAGTGPKRRTAAILATALAVTTASAHDVHAQSQEFRTRIDLVRTDVAVIDNRTGKPVTGLTARDFTVTEDGVPQTISTFVAEAGEALGGTPRSESAATGAVARTFLIVLGAGFREGTSDPYGGVARFLRQRLGPTDRAAVLVWDRVTPFTTDFDALARLAERRKRIPSDIRGLFRGDSQSGDSAKTRAALDRWLLPASEPQDFLRPVASLVIATDEFQRAPHIWHRLDATIAGSDLLKVLGGIELLRNQPGEKHLVLVSNFGLAVLEQIRGVVELKNSDQERALMSRAADAGVALHLITTYGTMHPPRLRYNLALMGAQAVATETGGQFTSLRTTEQQLARIEETSRHGYIIGYLRPNPEQDGKRRRVSFAVTRKGVTLVYRRAYTPRAELPPLDLREHLTRTRMHEAANAAVDLDDLPIRASATVISGAGLQVRVQMTIDPTRLPWTTRDGTRESAIDLTILCGDSRGAVIGKLAQHMTLSLDEAKYQQALKTGIPYTALIPVSGPPVHAKVVVYSFEDDRLGSVSLRVR